MANWYDNNVKVTFAWYMYIRKRRLISFLYVCMVNTIYLFSFVETPRKFINLLIYVINLRGVSTKLNK